MKKMKIILIIAAVAVAALVLGLLIGRSSRKQLPSPVRENNVQEKTTPASTSADTVRTSLSGKVYNLIILDESGSMAPVWKPSLDGANETIQTIKSTQIEHPDQKQFLTFVSFSDKGGDRIRILIDNMPTENVSSLSEEDYYPQGNTPLWDAMGHSLTKLEHEVTDQDLVLVTIITDGYENASRDYNGQTIKELIDRLSAKDWAFAYIGANQDAVKVAESMGINNALQFESDQEGTREMWQKERYSRERYYSRGRMGTAKSHLKDDYFEK